MSETLTQRLTAISEHDWRTSHLAHTSDTAREAIARIAELEAALAPAEWQPIDTAPNETEVWLYCPERGVTNRERIELGFASRGQVANGRSTMSYHSWATLWQPCIKPILPARTALGMEPQG